MLGSNQEIKSYVKQAKTLKSDSICDWKAGELGKKELRTEKQGNQLGNQDNSQNEKLCRHELKP